MLLFLITQEHCRQEMAKVWLHYEPSLFQHVGTTSSLKGKVQSIKDALFGRIPLYFPHKNPPASKLESTTVPHEWHTLTRAYHGETFFWGRSPRPGDILRIAFDEPLTLQ